MSIDMISDLAECLSSDDHGVICRYKGAEFSGIFNKEYFEQEAGFAGIASSEPVLYVGSDDIKGIVRGATITVDGIDFTVATIEPDGTGLTVLMLNG